MNIIDNKVDDRCYKCNGIGLIETKFILCNNCDGKKCFICRGTGILQNAWSECPRCLGNGVNDNDCFIYDKFINLRKNQFNKRSKSLD
jgi:hypothetical protein